MFQNFLLIHYVHVGDQADPTIDPLANMNLVLRLRQVSILDQHSLLHGPFVKGAVVINLGYVLRFGSAFKVEVASATSWIVHLVLYVAENVEEFLVMPFGEFDLLRQVVLRVLVGTTLAWLVGLILLCTHSHDILNALFHHGAIDALNTEDELE